MGGGASRYNTDCSNCYKNNKRDYIVKAPNVPAQLSPYWLHSNSWTWTTVPRVPKFTSCDAASMVITGKAFWVSWFYDFNSLFSLPLAATWFF